MFNLNRVEVIGNLTKDPELRFTPNNQAVCSFSVATNRRYRDAANNWVDSPPEYHEVIVWANLAERCNQLLHRGDKVFVSGRQQTRSWEAQDGSKRYKTELIADTIIGPDQLNKGSGSSEGNFAQEAPTEAPAAAPKVAKTSKPASAPADEEIN